jgi:hypothetical protein
VSFILLCKLAFDDHHFCWVITAGYVRVDRMGCGTRSKRRFLSLVNKVLIIDGSKTCINKLLLVENEGVGLKIWVTLRGHPL